MVSTRAKFVCQSKTQNAYNVAARAYKFSAVTDNDIPEDQRFHKYTPVGNLDITVDNPNVDFEVGQAYYLDFTPVEQ